jgi:hypothetical protein
MVGFAYLVMVLYDIPVRRFLRSKALVPHPDSERSQAIREQEGVRNPEERV